MSEKERKVKKAKKSAKKKLLVALSVILVISIALGTVVFVKYKQITTPPENIAQDTLTYDFDAQETVPETLESDPVFDMIYEDTAGSFKDSIKKWATNGGQIMYDDDVINVLCCGVDTRNPNAVAGLTDSIMIMSINTEKKTLTITSIMRDSFAYIVNPDGNGGTFNKINAAFPFYGVDGLIPAIENNFKIRIDGYALINFSLFKAAIDKLGGVTVPVQQYEANYVNKTYGLSVEAGDAVTLSGDEALAFCRSRNCDADGDVSRTRRQRQVILSILNECKDIKLSELDDYISTFLPYLQTSYSTTDVIELGTRAITEAWPTYDVVQVVAPCEEARRGYSGSAWYWAVDYPLAAQTVQLAIYGESNITLEEDRVTSIDLLTRFGEYY
jgi:LCP family protein required for cell wall assembly